MEIRAWTIEGHNFYSLGITNGFWTLTILNWSTLLSDTLLAASTLTVFTLGIVLHVDSEMVTGEVL